MAYRLGKLTSLDALLGQQIDVRARELEAAARSGAVPARGGRAGDRARARPCGSCGRAPRTAGPPSRPGPSKVTMLRSLYMDQDTQPETDRLNQKAGPSMQGLLATSHWERLRACGDAGQRRDPRLRQLPVRRRQGLRRARPRLRRTTACCTSSTGRPAARTTPSPRRSCCRCGGPSRPTPELARAAADGSLEIRGYLEYVAAGPRPSRSEPAARLPRPGRRRPCAPASPRCAPCWPTPSRTSRSSRAAFERRESGLCRMCNFAPVCA